MMKWRETERRHSAHAGAAINHKAAKAIRNRRIEQIPQSPQPLIPRESKTKDVVCRRSQGYAPGGEGPAMSDEIAVSPPPKVPLGRRILHFPLTLMLLAILFFAAGSALANFLLRLV